MSRGLEAGALADLIIVEVVARRDLHRAGAQLRIGMLVGDDRNQAAGDRMLDLLADDRRIALVIGMHRDRHVGEHRLRTRRRDMDRARAVGQRIFEVPEVAAAPRWSRPRGR